MGTQLQVDETLIRTFSGVIHELVNFQPFSSISFMMTEQIFSALKEGRRLANWGMAKNKPKMKEAALEIIDEILLSPPGNPVNLNLDAYQLKSLGEVGSLLTAALENKKDGLELI